MFRNYYYSSASQLNQNGREPAGQSAQFDLPSSAKQLISSLENSQESVLFSENVIIKLVDSNNVRYIILLSSYPLRNCCKKQIRCGKNMKCYYFFTSDRACWSVSNVSFNEMRGSNIFPIQVEHCNAAKSLVIALAHNI